MVDEKHLMNLMESRSLFYGMSLNKCIRCLLNRGIVFRESFLYFRGDLFILLIELTGIDVV